MSRARIPVVWIGLLALPLSIWGRRLPVQTFTVAEGLPRNATSCLAPGPTGVMWICSSEGLIRYDGSGFRVFGQESGLPATAVSNAIPARSGGYWIVTSRGVCRLEKTSRIGEPCRVIPGSAPGNTPIADVFESATGKTWFATDGRVSEIQQTSSGGRTLRSTTFLAPGHELIESLGDAADGGLYVGTSEGLYEFHEHSGQRQILPPRNAVWGFEDILRLRDGSVWLATTEGPARLLPGENPELRTVAPMPDWKQAHQVVQRRDGSLWFAVGSGLVRIDPATESREEYTSRDGLPTGFIVGVAEDSFGDLWGSTDGTGIFRIEESAIRSYDARDGLGGITNNARIASIFEDLEKHLCVLTSWDGGSLRVFSHDTFKLVEIPYPKGFTAHGWGSKQNGFQAHDGEWWFPSGLGLLRFTASTIDRLPQARMKAQYDVHSPMHCDDVVRAFEDSRGDVWAMCMAPDTGLIRWSRERDSFHTFGRADNWDPKQLAALILEPHPGDIWIIARQGFHHYRDGRFESFLIETAKMGVLQEGLFDPAGRLWLATTRGGVLRCDHPTALHPELQQYTVNEGLSVNNTRSLTVDREGYLYAGTVRGVDRIDPKAPIGKQYVRHFTSSDGLPNSEHSAAFTDSEGRLWFGTMGGIAELTPAQAPKIGPPSVFLTRVRLRGEEVPLEWEGATTLALRLAPERNQIEVTFSGTDTRPMASLRYQYRLIGVEDEWSQPTEHTTVNYSSLPAGKLRFEVRSFNSEGLASASVAGIFLDVAAPVWRRWWFLTSLAGLLAATAYSIDRYRLRQATAIERLRLRIATELHDDIGANLSQIAILTEVARRDGARSMLEEVPVIARETVELMSDIVWAVNPGHDGFDALLHRMRRFAGDTLGAADIDLDFSAPSKAMLTVAMVAPECFAMFRIPAAHGNR